MIGMDEKVIEKFWANVEKTDTCWLWNGRVSHANVPIICIGTHSLGTYQTLTARRVSLEVAGKLLPTSSHVKPLVCRNELCVNPDHLVQGDEARFWSYVQRLSDEECWPWIGHLSDKGYGKFFIMKDGKKKSIGAHVYSWEIYTGRPVPKDLVICHKCDHPYCVNPLHLFLGTNRDNIQDRHEKGRDAHGERTNTAKLTEELVVEIRAIFTTGEYTQKDLAQIFNLSPSGIGYMLSGKTWKHIPIT